MKRLIALLLCVLTVAVCFSSCAFDPEDKGAIIPIYLTDQQANLDPTVRIYDKDVYKYSSLLFEGLTTIDENGNIRAGLAEKWETDFNDERGEYFIEFTLKDSHWSDGRALLADHFVYAWKRLLSPANSSDAACLLYDIKNASKVKSGEVSVDDLGVSAPDRLTLSVQLENKIDINLFLEAVASPSLVPVRYEVVGEYSDSWATTTENLLSCGPFAMSQMDEQGYALDKSTNYLLSLDPEVQESPKKYVSPAKLYTDYSANLGAVWNAMLADELYYIDVAVLPEGAEKFEKDIRRDELLATTTLFLDNTNKLLSDTDVRRAMSLCLDRNALSELFGYGASAATGFVSNGVFDKNGGSFRKQGGALIASEADVNAAKALLAGKDLSTPIELTYRKGVYAQAATEIKNAWESIGLTVKLNALSDSIYENVLKAQDFDAVLLDFQGTSTSAYSFLMPLAAPYSGNIVDLDGEFVSPHMTGFDNEAYNELADRVHAATTKAERVELLHQMENLLVEQMPIIPLSFWSNCYITSSELSGLKFNGFGLAVFTNCSVPNYLEKNEAWLAAHNDTENVPAVEETEGE